MGFSFNEKSVKLMQKTDKKGVATISVSFTGKQSRKEVGVFYRMLEMLLIYKYGLKTRCSR